MKQSLPQVVVAQLGARMHYAVPVLLHRAGFLYHLFTDAYVGEGSWLHPLFQHLPQSLRPGAIERLSQRAAALPPDKVTAFNLFGFRYKLALSRSLPIGKHVTDTYLRYGKAFLKKVIASTKLRNATMVYGFTGTSLELLQAAKRQGLYRVMEQMSIPVRGLCTFQREEVEQWPDWQVTDDRWNEAAWSSRESEEWELADVIIAPSDHVAASLVAAGVSPTKIVMIPYAAPLDAFKGRERCYDGSRPLRVLFVGRIELLKGIPYLLEALRELGPSRIQARLVGRVTIRPEKLVPFRDVARTIGQVPRAEVMAHYNWADVFVLPSLCEGSATVTYEARACGLPVIATLNSGSWIQDREDGLTVPIRDSHSLAEALREFVKQPALVQQMSQAALRNAPKFSWEAYQQRLGDLVLSLHRD